MKKTEEILDILLGAISRENEAFNYYQKASRNSPYAETRALLIQLSEEERKHREILAIEYGKIRKLLSPRGKEYMESERVSYDIPEKLPYLSLRKIDGIQVAAVELPTRFLGGDYIDTFPIKIGNKNLLGAVIFDVMGHGTDATGLKALTLNTLDELKNGLSDKGKFNLANPSWLVSLMNRKLLTECRKKGSFVSLLYMVIDPKGRRLVYTSAGHEPAILIRKNGEELLDLSDSELLIGVEKQREYTQSDLNLCWGDLVLLFTDGLVELASSRGKQYGRDRLVDLLKKENTRIDSFGLLRKIFKDLKRFREGELFKDEISVIALKIEKEKKQDGKR